MIVSFRTSREAAKMLSPIATIPAPEPVPELPLMAESTTVSRPLREKIAAPASAPLAAGKSIVIRAPPWPLVTKLLVKVLFRIVTVPLSLKTAPPRAAPPPPPKRLPLPQQPSPPSPAKEPPLPPPPKTNLPPPPPPPPKPPSPPELLPPPPPPPKPPFPPLSLPPPPPPPRNYRCRR